MPFRTHAHTQLLATMVYKGLGAQRIGSDPIAPCYRQLSTPQYLRIGSDPVAHSYWNQTSTIATSKHGRRSITSGSGNDSKGITTIHGHPHGFDLNCSGNGYSRILRHLRANQAVPVEAPKQSRQDHPLQRRRRNRRNGSLIHAPCRRRTNSRLPPTWLLGDARETPEGQLPSRSQARQGRESHLRPP